jgi:parallel beta-helix repeat protein
VPLMNAPALPRLRPSVAIRIGFCLVLVAAVAQLLGVHTRQARASDEITYDSLGVRAARTTIGIAVAGRYAVPTNATRVQVNLAVQGAQQDGYLIVHPCQTVARWQPTVTYSAAQPISQFTVVMDLDSLGAACFHTSMEAEILVDRDGIIAVDPATQGTTPPASTIPVTSIAPTTTVPVSPTVTPTTVAGTTLAPTTAPATTATTVTAPATPTTIAPATGGATAVPVGPYGTVVGSQAYAVPAGAVIVATNGNDAAAGTAAAPLRTMARALAVVPAGGTIVLRAGSYNESVTITKKVTVQAWPGEAVWFDGSRQISNWVADGTTWRYDGWTTEFDSSPTYTRGAPDASATNWGFINPSYPLAAHPDQIWVDGTALRQVASRAAVVSGTFFHDEAANRLYIGTNPGGRDVRVAALNKAFSVRADATVLRGFGIRRYSPSVPDIGAVTLERPGIRAEHLAITDSATTALSAIAANIRVSNVSIARSGMLGIHASLADGLVIERTLSEVNNTEHFNQAPVSGGAKIGRTRVATVRDSVFRGNDGPGLWFDESVYDMRITGSEFRSNSGHGMSLEISAKAVVADNYITGNGKFGIKLNNTSDTKIWNNTFVGNNRNINIVQDTRRYSSGAVGSDPRFSSDPTMTWLIGPVMVANNVLAAPTTGNCLLCVEDYSQQRTAEQMGVTARSNVYNRPGSAPSWLVIWSRGAANPAVFTTLSAFQTTTGQEAGGTFVTTAVVNSSGAPTAAMPSASTAQPLPSDIAALIGQPAGARRLGAF